MLIEIISAADAETLQERVNAFTMGRYVVDIDVNPGVTAGEEFAGLEETWVAVVKYRP